MYCKCGNEVHPVRLELGYKTCVEHSTTQTYSYVPIIEHKTGNTIQIVSQEVSASVHRAWRRKQLDEWSNQGNRDDKFCVCSQRSTLAATRGGNLS